jgi:uncharacterized membrane protein YfcA
LDPLVIIFGLGVGMLVGLTGIGGGSLMTPLLILFAGVSPVTAIGTDLAYGAVTKTLGGWRHLRKGTVDLGVSKWLAVGSVPGALIGVWLVDRLHHGHGHSFDTVLLVVVGIVLAVVGLITLLRVLFMPKLIEREVEHVVLTGRVRASAAGMGLVLGLLVGGTSVGSGALIGLALIFVFRLTPHRVVGTDVFHAAILLWVAGIAHWIGGNVDFGLMGTILLGSLPGVWIGTALISHVPATGLRPALGCVLLGSAMAVLVKGGLDVPTGAIIAVPLAAGLVVWSVLRRRSVKLPLVAAPVTTPTVPGPR